MNHVKAFLLAATVQEFQLMNLVEKAFDKVYLSVQYKENKSFAFQVSQNVTGFCFFSFSQPTNTSAIPIGFIFQIYPE